MVIWAPENKHIRLPLSLSMLTSVEKSKTFRNRGAGDQVEAFQPRVGVAGVVDRHPLARLGAPDGPQLLGEGPGVLLEPAGLHGVVGPLLLHIGAGHDGLVTLFICVHLKK